MSDPRSRIPGVDALLEAPEARELLSSWPRARVTEALRAAAAQVRAGLTDGSWTHPVEAVGPYLEAARAWLVASDRPSLGPVVNATGVVLHTNLGRAPLAPEARVAVEGVLAGYGNLEFDLDSGGRGSRYDHCADLLRELTGAEDAVVVNNCAAALVLSMNTLARGAGVLVSRGELVEIGGGFRIPDMLQRAEARLVEVGSTNRTRVDDYRRGLDRDDAGAPAVGAILKVHRSNFRMSGFTEETPLDELVALGEARGVPVVHDVGSGLLVPPGTLGLPPEPMPSDSVRGGAALAVFSGDKLLGGPQAGIIVGRADRVEQVRRNPLCRAVRVDKATLAALEATLRLYRDPETVYQRIPVLRMLTASPQELEAAARRLAAHLDAAVDSQRASVQVAPGEGRVGGGTYPEHRLPGWTVRIRASTRSAEALARQLRTGVHAVVPRVEDDAVVLDVRTFLPGDEERVVTAVLTALSDLPD